MERANLPVTESSAYAAAGAVVIMEPNFTGHRWRYAQWIAEACVEAGYPCIVVTAATNEDHRLAREIVAAARPDLQIAFVDTEDEYRRSRLERISYVRFHHYFRHAYELVRDAQPIRLVVVPYVDYFLYALPFLGSPFGKTDWVALTMRATFHHQKVGVQTPARPLVDLAKSRLFRRAARTRGLQALLSIDPTLPGWCERAMRGHGAKVSYIADPFPDVPAENPAVARERLGLDANARYLLVYGSITERKGIYELVEALGRLDAPPTLIVAGEQESDVQRFLKARMPFMSPRPVVIDTFVSNELERDLFSACDAVWLGYKGHYGMSGVLVQAYRFGKPVIATTEGLIGWFCEEGHLGTKIADLKPDTIAHAIDELAAHWLDGTPPQPVATQSLLSRNTLANFKETFRHTLCDA